MIDHITLSVVDYEKSKAFYLEALKPLGYELVMEWEKNAGFGINGKPEFWICLGEKTQPKIHVAFRADAHEIVDRFYQAALAAGGIDNGAPGIREHYHPSYYGTFILDPDGHNIEAVCHTPE